MSKDVLDLSRRERAASGRRKLSLSVYISLLLVGAALFPLLITVVSSQVLARPALVTQASAALQTDAQARMLLINAYFVERLKDIQMVSQFKPLQDFLNGNKQSQHEVLDELGIAQHREAANYQSWSIFDPQGQMVLSYPTDAQAHGKYLILPEDAKQLQKSGKVLISDVFYDKTKNAASVDLYARIVTEQFQVLGFVRASLGLHHIWDIVDSEPASNGPGSYAFLLDQNNVRIAYSNLDPSGLTHPAQLFQAVAPLPDMLQQRVLDENLYGTNGRPVAVLTDQELATQQQNRHPNSTFQITVGQQPFQAARYSSLVVPWTYYILKPLGVVTSIADQQVVTISVIAAFVLAVAILLGLVTGQTIARPIIRSVAFLRRGSQSLKVFSNKDYQVVKQQEWMVEAANVALESVRYYTKANSVATERLNTIGIGLRQNWSHLSTENVNQALQEMLETTAYLAKAIKHQHTSNEKLATAMRVTTQATEQLSAGVRSADEAASQLENAVNQLRSLLGNEVGS
ncbi:MAG TPA: cache domain-containing protein [Ktedonosporobacter sp.]|nr:cache domain-containing protein [Ktedonosporobacter sp.]